MLIPQLEGSMRLQEQQPLTYQTNPTLKYLNKYLNWAGARAETSRSWIQMPPYLGINF